MTLAQVKSPVYDERVTEIIRALTEGQSREEIAKRYDYASYRSMDMYLRRKGFIWDPAISNYVPGVSDVDLTHSTTNTPSKVALVISLFAEGGDPDPRSVARQAGFKDHREMADYLKQKGYVWSSEEANYVEFAGEVVAEASEDAVPGTREGLLLSFPASGSSPDPTDWETYLPLLQILLRNKERLLDLLVPASEEGTVPHFAVPGTVRTKSVYMSELLSNLVGQFCESRNLTQKQAYEAAMI